MSTLDEDTAITLKVGFPAIVLVILMGQERTRHYGQVWTTQESSFSNLVIA